MKANRKQVAARFRGLARAFGGIGRRATGRSVEEAALDYHEAAERAGVLLVEAHQSGLLPEVPGLAKLLARDLDAARLFKQFHGYEVNTAALLTGCCEPPPADAVLTCGLLPRLLPDNAIFRPRSYRGNDGGKEALLTELERAREACKWIAAQIDGRRGDESPAPKSRSATKTSAKTASRLAKARRNSRTKTPR